MFINDTRNFWEINAKRVAEEFGGQVNWEDRFYICPFCGEPVYEEDWDPAELEIWVCPICEDDDWHGEDDDEPADLECGFDPYEGAYSYDC